MSVAKAIAVFSKAGLVHKHVAARSSAGRLIANMVNIIFFRGNLCNLGKVKVEPKIISKGL
jgi:hypothetical protein